MRPAVEFPRSAVSDRRRVLKPFPKVKVGVEQALLSTQRGDVMRRHGSRRAEPRLRTQPTHVPVEHNAEARSRKRLQRLEERRAICVRAEVLVREVEHVARCVGAHIHQTARSWRLVVDSSASARLDLQSLEVGEGHRSADGLHRLFKRGPPVARPATSGEKAGKSNHE